MCLNWDETRDEPVLTSIGTLSNVQYTVYYTEIGVPRVGPWAGGESPVGAWDIQLAMEKAFREASQVQGEFGFVDEFGNCFSVIFHSKIILI